MKGIETVLRGNVRCLPINLNVSMICIGPSIQCLLCNFLLIFVVLFLSCSESMLNASMGASEPSTSQQSSPPSPDPILNAKRPWPAMVQLPKSFRPELSHALQSANPKSVTPRLRRAFNQRLFDYFSQYTL